MRTNCGLITLVLLALVAGCNSQSWKEYKAPDGKFTVQFPGVPSQEPEPDGGEKVSATLKADKDLLFFVRYKDLPKPLSPAEFDQMAASARDSLASQQGNKLLAEKSVSLGKHPGKETRVALGGFDDVSISRSYAVGSRYYSVTAIVPKKHADSADVSKFLDSFQVTD